MNQILVALGSVGTAISFVILYYATGILLHFTTFDASTVTTYQERLRLEQSFSAPLISIILYAACTGIAGAALLAAPAYVPRVLVTGIAILLLGLTYFLRQMTQVTTIT